MPAPFGTGQRGHRVAIMAEVERKIGAGVIEVTVELPTTADARWCIDEYFKEIAQRFEFGFDPVKSNPASDEDMSPPNGFFIVARLDGYPVGCAVLKRKSETTAEIKRMWTASYARGRGVALKVLRTLEDIAREIGVSILQLETNKALKEAQALYRKAGFREVPPFNGEVYAHHWFEKHL